MNTARPRHTWVPYVAALAGAALLLKTTLAIAGEDGVNAGPIFGVLYLTGLALGLAATIGTGLRRERVGTRIVVAIGLSVLFIEWILGLGDALKPVIGQFSDAQNVQIELPVGIAGAALLLLAYVCYSHDQGRVHPEVVDRDRVESSHTL